MMNIIYFILKKMFLKKIDSSKIYIYLISLLYDDKNIT